MAQQSPPVHSLFNELLVEIFRYYLNPPNESGERYLPPAWRYSAVCRRWRGVALQDPLLWTMIDIDVSKYTQRSRHNLQNYVNTLLERSQKNRIDVRLAGSAYYVCWRTVSIVQSAQPRWASLKIDSHVTSLFTTIFAPSQTSSWSSLVSLDVDLKLQGEAGMLLDLRGLGRLEEFHEWTTLTVCYILLPWPTLKAFYLHVRQPCHRVACDFDDGPALEVCFIELSNTWDRRPPGAILPEPRCLFPNVKQLTLINCSPMLPYFENAALERLNVNLNLHSSNPSMVMLHAALASSRASLRELRLRWASRAISDREVSLIEAATDLLGLETFDLETQNREIILSSATGELSLSESSSQAVGQWVSRFAATEASTPCPSLRHWKAVVKIQDHGTRTGHTPDWRILRDTWSRTWESREPLQHCSLVVNIEGQAQHFFVS